MWANFGFKLENLKKQFQIKKGKYEKISDKKGKYEQISDQM